MKRLYKISYVMILLITISLSLIYVLNSSFIRNRIKSRIIDALETQTQKMVDIGDLHFSATRGFTLSGIDIYDAPDQARVSIFKADSISFTIIPMPSFKPFRLVVPRMTMEGPYLRVDRNIDGRFDILDLLANAKRPSEPQHISISINSVSFDNASISFTDRSTNNPFSRDITGLRGTIGISLPQSISINCIGRLSDSPIRLIAKYKPFQKHISFDLRVKSIEISDYFKRYLTDSPLFSGMTSGKDGEGPVDISAGLADIMIQCDIDNLADIDSKFDIAVNKLRADVSDIALSGDYKIRGKAAFELDKKALPIYEIVVDMENAHLSTPVKTLRDITDMKGRAMLSQEIWTLQNLSASIYGAPALINGVVKNPHGDFLVEATVSSQIKLTQIADIVKADISSGTAAVETNIHYQKSGLYNIGGKAKIDDLRLQQDNIILSGNFVITGESSGKAKEWDSLSYKGEMKFDDAMIEGAGLLPIISEASGDATFSTGYLRLDRLSGVAAQTKISISGDINYKEKEPSISLTLKTGRLPVAKFISSLPDHIRSRLNDIEADGLCSLDIDLRGRPHIPETINYEGSLKLEDCDIKMPYWPDEISKINCRIGFNKQLISWDDLSFVLDNTRYNCSGSLNDLAQPKINLKVRSDIFTIDTDIQTADDVINITKCDGRYLSSDFSVTGKIMDIKSTNASLQGSIDLDLSDAASIFKAHAKMLNSAKPKGVVKIRFTMGGMLKDISGATILAEGSCDRITAWDLGFDDFYFDYRMKDRFIDMPVMVVYPYAGIININARANLKTAEQPYIINIDVKDIDLQSLIKDTKSKSNKIKGKLAAKAVLNGYASKKNSLQGNGWLQVSEGYLWEFPVVHGILDMIFMIPPEYVTLTDAFGNFSLNNNRVYTEDFKMLSKTASLLWVGSLGIDGTLDFNITGRFAEDVIKQTSEPGRIASAILREAGNLIMEIRLTGSLANPKYQIVPFPVNRIFKENVVDRFKDIFGNIF